MDLNKLADVFKALGDPTRLKIIETCAFIPWQIQEPVGIESLKNLLENEKIPVD